MKKIAILATIGVIILVGILYTNYVVIGQGIENISLKNDDDQNISKTPSILQDSKLEEQSSEILSKCNRDDECVINHLRSLSHDATQEEFLLTVHEVVSRWDTDGFYCHPVAHHLGEFLLGYFNGDVVEAISHVDNKCGNALYHGITENYLSIQLIMHDIALENLDFKEPCIKLGSSSKSYAGLACVHGMGHGLATVYDFDVFEAVKNCDEFKTEGEQLGCQGGVFMQSVLEFYYTGEGSFDKDDLLYPCNQVDRKYQERCYLYQSYHILSQNNYSPANAFAYCEKIPYEESIRSCFKGIGLNTANYNFFNIEKTAKMCNQVNPQFQEQCIVGALGFITTYVDSELGGKFCKMVEENNFDLCNENWVKHREKIENQRKAI